MVHDATGGLAGGQIGYRWQATNWVFGIEAQGDWANLKGSNTSAIGAFGGVPFVNQTKINSIGLFTGQIGYAWNNVLAYLKGGAALTNDKYAGTPQKKKKKKKKKRGFRKTLFVCWSLIEFAFAPPSSVATEYDHLFMTHALTFVAVPAFSGGFLYTDGIKQDVDIATVRVNYTFGGPVSRNTDLYRPIGF